MPQKEADWIIPRKGMVIDAIHSTYRRIDARPPMLDNHTALTRCWRLPDSHMLVRDLPFFFLAFRHMDARQWARFMGEVYANRLSYVWPGEILMRSHGIIRACRSLQDGVSTRGQVVTGLYASVSQYQWRLRGPRHEKPAKRIRLFAALFSKG